MKKWIQNEHGLALPAVLLVMTLFTILGVSVLTLSLNNYTTGRYELEDEAAYYIAEGGLEAATIELKKIEADVWAEADTEEDTLEDIINQVIARFQSEAGRTLQYAGSENGTPDSFQNKYGRTEAIVTIRQGSADNELILRSAGTIENNNRTVERVLEKTVRVEMDPQDGTPGSGGSGGTGGEDTTPDPGGGTTVVIPGNSAVFVQSNISLTGGATITGNVGFNDSSGQISLKGGASINGTVYVPPGASSDGVSAPHYMTKPPVATHDGNVVLPQIAFPNVPVYPVAANQTQSSGKRSYNVIDNGKLSIKTSHASAYTWNMEETVSLQELELTSNTTLTIDTGSAHKTLVVDKLDLQQGHIHLTGSGSLTIFVTDELSLGGGSTINDNTKQSDRLTIVMPGKQELRLGGSQFIYGSLLAENADLSFGGGAGFQGDLYTGGANVEFSGGTRTTSSVVYAPNAHVKLKGGASVKGAVISQSFEGDGGSSVVYGPYELNPGGSASPGTSEPPPKPPTQPAPGTGGAESYIDEDKTVEVSP